MEQAFDISIEISAGKKDFTVIPDTDDRYTLKEAGSIVAVIKKNEDRWIFTTGSYSDSDAEKVGAEIVKNL